MTDFFFSLKGLMVLFPDLSQTLRGSFVGPRSFSYFSAQGSEKGGEAEPAQKATLFPSGSALHPTMNGVLKNITLGTRLFFIPHFTLTKISKNFLQFLLVHMVGGCFNDICNNFHFNLRIKIPLY